MEMMGLLDGHARDEEISRRNLSSRGFGDDTNQGTHKVTNGLSVQNDGCEMGAFERYCYGRRVRRNLTFNPSRPRLIRVMVDDFLCTRRCSKGCISLKNGTRRRESNVWTRRFKCFHESDQRKCCHVSCLCSESCGVLQEVLTRHGHDCEQGSKNIRFGPDFCHLMVFVMSGI